MKSFIAYLIASASLLVLQSCTTVVETPAPVTRTTTTEETTVRHPNGSTGTTTETHETQVRRN